MHTTEKALIKSLIHVIWADGEVSDEERLLLGKVIAQLDLDEKDLGEVATMMAKPPDLSDLKKSLKDVESRKEVVKVLLAMAMADGDGQVAVSEMRFLSKVAHQLDLSESELEALKQETLNELNAEED